MPLLFFYTIVAIMLGFAGAVVLLRNPVSSALALVASFAGLAGLYISLDAYFVGTLQVLVYAGAVMVLFLFIIMLMDIKAEARRKINKVAVVGGVALVFGFVIQLGGVTSAFVEGYATLNSRPLDYKTARAARANAGQETETITADLTRETLPDAKLVGETLFSRYNLHLQIVGVILLVATVGVVVLSRREDRVRGGGLPPPLESGGGLEPPAGPIHHAAEPGPGSEDEEQRQRRLKTAATIP
jgi:NADH-quinone oxidoreductase subunit J